MSIRYAVVGAGWISQIAFMPGTAQAENSRLTAIVTGNTDTASKLASFYGIEHIYSYDQYDQMLADDVVDAVYVALPNGLHAEYAIRAAKAGKHVLVEKPLAVSVEECRAMIAAAEEAGVYLATAYRLHNEPGNLHALKLIRDGAIGDPRIFSSMFSFIADTGNHRLKAANWGGPLQDIGIYCLNAVRHVFEDEPLSVSAIKNQVDDPRFGEVEETFAATLLFPEGRLAQFTASFGAADLDVFRVAGTEGELMVERAYDFQSPTTVRHFRAGEVVEHYFPQTDHFAGQTDYFSQCILSGTPPEPDGYEGLADVTTLVALERVAQTGRIEAISLPPRDRRPGASMRRTYPTTSHRLMV
ncbi:MAG: Gfo/Idh/MocA family oxidoreductase [Pseudomonadota bacterium]